MVIPACNSSTWEVGKSGVQGHPKLQSKAKSKPNPKCGVENRVGNYFIYYFVTEDDALTHKGLSRTNLKKS